MKKTIKLSAFIFVLYLFIYLPRLNAGSVVPFMDMQPDISMDLQGADLKDILKIFSIQSGLNFIAAEGVQDKKITLYLDKVPIDKAMDKIFRANNLSYELDKDSGIFIVKDMGKVEVDKVTRVFYLKYASVSASPLTSEKTSAGATAASPTEDTGITGAIKKLLSEYGTIIEDYRTNSLIVSDIPTRMEVIAKAIASIDVSVPQVLIEVEMLDVSKNTVDAIGFKYGQTPFTAVLSGTTVDTGFPFHSWSKFFVTENTKGSLALNSGASSYTVTMDFLRTQSDTKTLARPRILTLNNETAEIKITTQETVGKITSQTGGSSPLTTESAERMETGVSLRVTPQINAETGEVTMFIVPTVKDATTSTLAGINAKDPEERSTKSVVRVKDGDTVILGGLIRRNYSETVTKLPVLGDIPLMGRLFRHKSMNPDKDRELLVFITPRIVKDANIELAKAKEKGLPAREQGTASGANRELAISSGLNSFEKKKK